ncbi:MAG: geranylgeranyl reductase family protein [Candidatus Anstonellales archaeon]
MIESVKSIVDLLTQTRYGEVVSSSAYDAIVVGGGPAGSTCAALLGRRGHNVLLIEKNKFPRDKICGDAVSGKSMKVLNELGLLQEAESLPHGEIRGVIFSSPSGEEVRIEFPKNDPIRKGTGYCCRRIYHDNLLFQNAKKYAKTLENFQVYDLILNGKQVVGVKGRNTETGEEQEFGAKVVVGCDGVGSIVARKTGNAQTDPKHLCQAFRAYYKNVAGLSDNIEIHFVDSLIPGYFWIFPVGEDSANVGVGMVMDDVTRKKINLRQALLDIVLTHPRFKDRFKDAIQEEGSVKAWSLPFGSRLPKCYGDGFVLCGDAASLVDPFSGEGVGNAMTSASIAAKVISQALSEGDTSAKSLSRYENALISELKVELDTSYLLQRLGRVTPILNFIIGKARKSQEVRETISGMLANQEAKKEFISPLFYLRLLLA